MNSEEIFAQDAVEQKPEMSFEHSTAIGELIGALALAQLDFKPIVRDTINPYYGKKYADLSQCIAATQPALAKNGLVVIQFPNADTNMKTLRLVSVLGHSSGQWMRATLTLPAEMSGKDGKMRFDSQSVGAAMTYARRYSYQCLTGTAAETDDDGNAAVGNGTKQAAQTVAKDKLAAKGVPIGTILAGPHVSDPDLWTIVPTWSITDNAAKLAAAEAMKKTIDSFYGVFLENAKHFTVPKAHAFEATEALVKQGWKLVTAGGEGVPASQSEEGFCTIDDIRYPRQVAGRKVPFAFIHWGAVEIPIWKDGESFDGLKEAYKKKIPVNIVYTTKPNPKDPKKPYHDLVSFTWGALQQIQQ
jgi:hypothetical protein